MITRCPVATRLLYAVQFIPKSHEAEKHEAFSKYRDHLHSCEECRTAIQELNKSASRPTTEEESMLNKKSLKNILNKLTSAAEKNEGVPQKFILSSGLVIEIMKDNNTTNLFLNRAGHPPSDHDWRMVSSCLPGITDPVRELRNGKPCMMGKLVTA